MDACLTQAEAKPSSTRATPPTSRVGWVGILFACTVAAGLLWRIVRYVEQFPIWGDEAMLLMSILDRDYFGLMQPLAYAQVAPLFFLWLEKSAIVVFGTGEWSLHLFPTLAGATAFFLFWRLCRVHLPPVAAGLAVAVLAVSYYPIRHACEVKPYAFDLCFSVVYARLAMGYLRHRTDAWLMALAFISPVAVFSSYPSAFVGGAVSLVLLPTMRAANGRTRTLFVLFNLLMVSSFAIHVICIGGRNADSREVSESIEFLRTYWKDAFPPHSAARWPMWLVQTFTGNMLAYPLGAKTGGSTVTFLLVVIGSISLWRQGRRDLLALCWLPFALNFVAACFKKYPFGDSARITLHLAPFICILMAVGLAQSLDWIRNTAWHERAHISLYLILMGCGLFGIVRDLRHPYKTEHDHACRALVRELASMRHGEPVVLAHANEKELLAELLWHLRTENLDLHWQAAPIDDSSRFYWSVRFALEPLPERETAAGWRIVQSETRMVPPENPKMATVHVRMTRLERE